MTTSLRPSAATRAQALAVPASLWTAAAVAGCAAPAPSIDPAAERQLEAVAAALKGAEEVSFLVGMRYWPGDRPVGKPLNNYVIRYRMQRSGRLRCDARGEVRGTLIFDRGRLLCALGRRNAYTVIDDFAPNVEQAVRLLGSVYGLTLPMAELLLNPPLEGIRPRLGSARVVREESVDGRRCTVLELSFDDSAWTIWIDRDSPALPRRALAVFRGPRGELATMEAALGDWSPAPGLTDADFAFDPPRGMRRVKPEEIHDLIGGRPVRKGDGK